MIFRRRISANWRYLGYVLRHKWYVLVGCLKVFPTTRMALWVALTHDLSKFSAAEWGPYVSFFYGDKALASRRDSTGYYKPYDTGSSEFERAWLHHFHHNPHHWQYWVVPTPEGDRIHEMGSRYVQEMVADWYGAGMAQGKPDIWGWYQANKDKMVLGPATRGMIEIYIKAFFDNGYSDRR